MILSEEKGDLYFSGQGPEYKLMLVLSSGGEHIFLSGPQGQVIIPEKEKEQAHS